MKLYFNHISLLIIFYFFISSNAMCDEIFPLCNWQTSPTSIITPYPVFSWNANNQIAYRILVAEKLDDLKNNQNLIWDSGTVNSSLSVAEYAGKLLKSDLHYFWQVIVWNANESQTSCSQISSFQTSFQALPKRNGFIRTFLNFGGQYAFIANHYDLTHRLNAKKYNPSIIVLNYSLIATMVFPSTKAALLNKYCRSKGLPGIPEEMFLHLKEDHHITLRVGKEDPKAPLQTRLIPGWNPVNDTNGDGNIDAKEYSSRISFKANARAKRDTRLPIYYWGPPNYDYIMNISNPLYQDFLIDIYLPNQLKGFDGLFIDTTESLIPGPGRFAPVLEFPDNHAWGTAMQKLMKKIKIAFGKPYIYGNGWYADPLVIDGTQIEEWLDITKSIYDIETVLSSTQALENRGKLQMLQYNPTYNSQWISIGKRSSITSDKDLIFGLAMYYLIQGNFTYFGCGKHPYDKSEINWFAAMDYDLGKPIDKFKVIMNTAGQAPLKSNLLKNSGFELPKNKNRIPSWNLDKSTIISRERKESGNWSAKITSKSLQANILNSQTITLKPYTIYTAGGFIATDNLTGAGGAQIYPYGEDNVQDIDNAVNVYFRSTEAWRFFSCVFKTGESGNVRINFRVRNAIGTAWFDNLFLVEGSYPYGKVYSRTYEKGLVFVKIGANDNFARNDQAATIDLDDEYKLLRYDATLSEPVRKIKLINNEACILIRRQK